MATTGIAERIAYGRPIPLDEVSDGPIPLVPRATTLLIGRILMSAIFVSGGINKLMHINETAGYMAQSGIPAAHTLAIVAAVAELLGGLAVLFGFLARLGALGLFIYLIPVTLVFHAFWKFEGVERQMQMTNFMKNLGIMGGFLLLYALGPGRYSLDARLRRPLAP